MGQHASIPSEPNAESISAQSDMATRLTRSHLLQTGLANDVILDNILPNLEMEDIIRLRQVNDQLNRCSHESVIWKRIIARTKHGFPPVPPTERYSFANLTALEAERLLTRSISLPKEWEKSEPTYLRKWDIEGGREVLEMTLLPGGQYLVASVTNRSRTRYSIEIYTSDFGYSMGFPVARLDTGTKSFDLSAKYMKFYDRQGIAIAYVRRYYRHRRYAKQFDVNDLPPDCDRFSSMVKYECTVVHVSLDSLELLFDNRRPWDPHKYRTLAMSLPRPFQVLTEITSHSLISTPTISDDIQGAPFVAIVKHPDRIVYKNLEGGLGCTMFCAPHPSFHTMPQSIMSFVAIPSQHQFFLIRRAGIDPDPDDPDDTSQGPYYFAELYDIVYAPNSTLTLEAASRSEAHNSNGNFWHKVWISDPSPGPSLRNDQSIRSYLHVRNNAAALPPMNVFVQAHLTYGISYEPIIPVPVPLPSSSADSNGTGGTTTYRYQLYSNTPLLELERLPEGMEGLNDLYEHRVLLGSTRPVIYTIPRKDSSRPHAFQIRMLGGIHDPRLLAYENARGGGGNSDAAEDAEGEASGEAEGESEIEVEAVNDGHHFKLEMEALSDVSAIAWDETIGRLCIGYADNTRIAVFDFAGAPVPGAGEWCVHSC